MPPPHTFSQNIYFFANFYQINGQIHHGHPLGWSLLCISGFTGNNCRESWRHNRLGITVILLVYSWLEVYFGIPQGSILGTLLFNIFINDIFLFLQETEVCNFADDNTLFACDTSVEKVLSKLNKDLHIVNYWFINNSLVANTSKFQLMFLGVENPENLSIHIADTEIFAKKEVELLGVTIDY